MPFPFTGLSTDISVTFTAKSERTYLFIASGLLVLYVFPYLWLGEDAYVTIHDNLDSDFLYLYLLKITGTAFDFDLNTVLPDIMNGVPRSALRSGLNLEVLSFYLLPPYVAYVGNLVAVHGIGFAGMYLLLKRHVLPERTWSLTRVAVAFLFALVPTYIVHGVSVTGQPLLLYAFLNLLTRKQPNWTDWLIITLFPFYSFFVWSGLFICFALAVLGLASMRRRKRINWSYMGGLLLLSLLYLASEWQMIYSFLAKTYSSQRTEYDYARLLPLTVEDSFQKAFDLFTRTYYHSGSFSTLWILAIVGFTALRSNRSGGYTPRRGLATGVGVAMLVCLFSGFYRFPAVWLGKGSPLQVFQFDRFYFLLPLLWFYLFSLSLRAYKSNSFLNRLFLIGQFMVMLLANHKWTINIEKMTGQVSDEDYPSYRAFYAPDLFSEVRDYIGRPQATYRVVSLGMHPAVALYNGFYTLDSYQNNYLVSYKHSFRRVIARELAKAPAIATYYDAYGCRCYTYSAELGMSPESALCGKHKKRSITKLALDVLALKSLGGRYVLSAVPIRNAIKNRLRLRKEFDDPASYWRIWLYEVMK